MERHLRYFHNRHACSADTKRYHFEGELWHSGPSSAASDILTVLLLLYDSKRGYVRLSSHVDGVLSVVITLSQM